jgi:acyl-CoA synthetase (AMP-forming)/AMP-acid ligase II
VYPSEVERVLLQADGIAECAVVAGPHERWGQTPVAFLVRSGDATEESVMAFARERLAGYKLPTSVRFIDALPKNASNKIVRRRLRDELEAEQQEAPR